ncbi:MAG: DNA-processing protein DprA [Myxococcales bacterium]|nr:DNA-processing protein DprA [Myxococcales bacterium]
MRKVPIPHGRVPETLVAGSPDYPSVLLDLPDPPKRLRSVGSRPLLPGVAIVGTRAASEAALEFTYDLASDLAAEGCTVVSGGARGIDTAAHRGALAVGGATVALLATGLRYAYPPENASLFGDIVAAGGALLSEVSDDTVPHGGQFLRRNRLVAALAMAVVVVQAPLRSGALSTATIAKRLKRHVFSVPGSPWDGRATGSNRLLRLSALVCTSARDVLSVRPPTGSVALPASPATPAITNDIRGLDNCCRAVLGQLEAGVRNSDQIAAALDIRINRVHECLLSLELAGVAYRNSGGRYELKPRRTGRRPRYGSDQEEGHEKEGQQEEGDQEEADRVRCRDDQEGRK